MSTDYVEITYSYPEKKFKEIMEQKTVYHQNVANNSSHQPFYIRNH